MQNLDPHEILIAVLVVVGLGVLAALVALAVVVLAARGGPASSTRFQIQKVSEPELEQYFAKRATFATTVRLEYAASPDKVWRALLDEGFLSWWPTVKGCKYRTDSRSVGARRTFLALWASAEAEFVVVEPGRTLAYSYVGASLPGLRDFAERFVLDQASDGGTVLEWTVGVSPILVGWVPVRWTAPFVRPFLKPILWGLRSRT